MADTANSSSILGINGTPQFFLVKNGEKDVKALEKCEKLIQDYWGSQAQLRWLTTEECLDLSSGIIAKTDVFVFPEFKGPAFESLRNRKTALLLGPPVLTKCLVENEIIPTAPPPWIFNTAMNGLVVTLSGFREADKKKYSDLISFMGGLCMTVLPERGTHLVSNTVFSAKYEAAVQMNIPVMQVQWIDEVWTRNATEFAAATESQFDAFKLPVFYNLNVACTLLTNDEKTMVERLVTGNGGIFHRSFKPNVVNLLVVNENGKSSDKFKAACKHKKICVLPSWIADSVKEGYALPFQNYEVAGEVRVSTPNKDAVQNPEFSVSHIQGTGNTTVNESLVSVRSKNLSTVSEFHIPVPTDNPGVLNSDYYKEEIKNMNVTKAKRAGCFLDGCNIFFSGFTAPEMTKLNKIITLSGATRFDDLNENVTHVIIGKREDKELKGFQDMNKGIHFVKFDWLKESMEAGHAANEDDHCYELVALTNNIVLMEQPSPASKRNIAAMNSSFKKPFPKNDNITELSKKPSTAAADPEEEDEFVLPRSNLMNRYLLSSAGNMEVVPRTAPKETEKENAVAAKVRRTTAQGDNSRLMHTTFGSELDTDEYEHLNFFNGKKFALQAIDNEHDYTQVLTDIQNFGGSIVERTFKGEVDYLVTAPEPITSFKPTYKAKEIVTIWWIEDVIAARSEVPVAYYHKMILVTDATVLQGITCAISMYSGAERMFLTLICEALGATVEEKYEKRKHPILLCEKPEGSKYKGAVNWGFPVVRKDWLLDSYGRSYLHKLEDYLVGESKVDVPVFVELNERGIHKGADLPSHNNSSVIQLRSESPLLSQVPASPMVATSKRKSDDRDTFVRTIEKKLKLQDNMVLLPHNSPSVNNRVKALRTESKSSSSPTTPISAHIREMGQEFGYDTPRRKQLYDVLKETKNLTPATPHTPDVMKMPNTQLHPDPEATPGRQWDVLHKFSGFLGSQEKKEANKPKTTKSPATPLSEIKRRFWQQTLGDDYVYNNNSTMLNINSQQLQVQNRNSADETTMLPVEQEAVASTSSTAPSPDRTMPAGGGEEADGSGLQGLTNFISNRKSEPKKALVNLETCPVQCPTDTEVNEPEFLVGWAEPNEVVPFTSPSASKEATNRPLPYFITSGLELDSSTLMNMVRELGGDVQEKKGDYDAKCTHVICFKPSRVEKVLCAMAAGKWIVSLKYIEDSYQAKKYLDEELYEWGNPKCDSDTSEFSAIEKRLATAAHSWRLKIQDKDSEEFRTGAFHGFRVLLWTTKPGFQKIITSGGGTCLDVGTSYRQSEAVARTATHCFVEKKQPFPEDNLKFCQEIGVQTTDIQYLNEYLLNDGTTTIADYGYKGRTSGGGRK